MRREEKWEGKGTKEEFFFFFRNENKTIWGGEEGVSHGRMEANENGKKAGMNLKREDGGRKRRGGEQKKEVETLHTGR